MKKLLLSTLFVFLLFVPFVSCDSPASLSEEKTSKIDRTFWWRSTEDDPGLRKRFETGCERESLPPAQSPVSKIKLPPAAPQSRKTQPYF